MGIWAYMTSSNLAHLVDILIIWFLLYKVITFVEGTRALQILIGVGVIVLVKVIAWSLGLVVLSWLMDQIITWAPIALVVIFQQEIRRGLESLGRRMMVRKQHLDNEQARELIRGLDMALQYMSKRRIGALITINGKDTLEEYIKTGIPLNATVTGQLLINIFIPNTPLHDGAVIINNDEVAVAAAYLPLSESTRIPKELGTRHRAAVGISEATDAVTVVVSEETGEISITQRGDLLRNMDQESYLNFFEKQWVEPVQKDQKRFAWLQFLLKGRKS
ncbi:MULTISPECIES: diadenylate cyclase CdaA [Fructobacillus]|uniref:Diadenylate cyclase n=2 Tax=Fructobacillus TaxID=559173 RepID=A0ABS5QRI9_9LACO|nr:MULTISPECIES: diadenylate cyclase CdaA [Fructobacillus]MBS9335814.1 TIGR00159 family protein [Fructobacillus papyrifericola]MBS9337716.1 TIGR00159 family protein [Fructobacillus parabroussonetiae]